MDKLPWVDPFLKAVQHEYQKPPPQYRLEEPSPADLSYMERVAMEADTFDTLGLKRECWLAYTQGKATIVKSSCPLGTICLLSLATSPVQPTWNTWWRAVRLLTSPTKPVRIIVFAHPRTRELPPAPRKPGPADVNGGATMRCDPQSIVVYRKEELTRVMIHELFHSSCSDPYHKDTPEIESDTEAWTELLLCAMAVKGAFKPWTLKVNQQFQWALRQEATTRDSGQIKSRTDYGWRYLTGRLDVWRRLGLPVPELKGPVKPVTSLRFTICEPKDV
jgi:hypothetical protein